MYQKGDYIVYGASGPCQVMDVTRLQIPGCDRKRKYYILHPVNAARSTIYSPVDNNKVPMRDVVTRQEAESVFAEIPSINLLKVASEKFREEEYKDIIWHCDIRACLGMMKMLIKKRNARLAAGRKFTSVDERYLKEGINLVSDELSIAMGENREESRRRLTDELDRCCRQKE